MATFYILFSKSIDRYYVGSCLDLEKRISEHNVLGLCEGGEIEAQMFKLAQVLIRIPMLKFSTNAPLLQNPC